jgi:hypothetical protein
MLFLHISLSQLARDLFNGMVLSEMLKLPKQYGSYAYLDLDKLVISFPMNAKELCESSGRRAIIATRSGSSASLAACFGDFAERF